MASLVVNVDLQSPGYAGEFFRAGIGDYGYGELAVAFVHYAVVLEDEGA